MNKFYKWIQLISSWDNLYSLGNSKILKSSYLWFFFVPVAAKFLSQFNFPISVTFWGTTHTLDPSLPFSWIMLYAASLVFSAASLGYSLKCPKLIKDYKTFSNYYQAGNGYMQIGSTIIEAASIFETKKNKARLIDMLKVAMLHAKIDTTKIDEIEDEIIVNFIPKGIQLLPREELGDIFSLVSKASGKLYLGWRLALLSLYGIGFALLLILFIQNLTSVIKLIN